MSRAVAGSIPEKIAYVYSTPKDVHVGCGWDISWHADEKPKNVTMTVAPSFPIDIKDEKAKATAIGWASNGGWDYATKTRTVNVHQIEEFDNAPIKGVKVLSLEERGNGGRAYKIVIADKYYVDLREDVMMDTILKLVSLLEEY